MKPVLSAGMHLGFPLMILFVSLVLLSGCSSPDPENQAYRPWGAPQGQWGSGLPSSMTEGR